MNSGDRISSACVRSTYIAENWGHTLGAASCRASTVLMRGHEQSFRLSLLSCACSLFNHTVWGALSLPHTSRRSDRHLRDVLGNRSSRAALGNPQDKRHIRQTYSGRSARVASRLESQAAPIPIFNLPRQMSSPIHISADMRIRPTQQNVFNRAPVLMANFGHMCSTLGTRPGRVIDCRPTNPSVVVFKHP